MGCLQSTESLDLDTIQSVVLRTSGGIATYSGTTERGRCQTLGDAEMALSEDCFYSQVIGTGCCGDQGLMRIPISTVKDIRQQSYFNGRYRVDHPHLVITYTTTDTNGSHEHQAGWQMNDIAYNQWKTAIEQLKERNAPPQQA
ncbi:unnamed protein product [Rotaria magnacalcarata]|uniref:Uncharacterized protein n=1 Tax=Rotaria magnacalcarata TaxID=392030 RepID=A0A819GKL5_9BILA|nr:unnamed protein product [Rotaria magnacalcarata]CAF2132678.1 unnamed protein product [Rotaria magnacalcarata]CAF3885010.1 unnamed protein product [Rotaria magnacalcarata]CAF4117932.1 unnamed protein product [Rotaria magnacalcarata]